MSANGRLYFIGLILVAIGAFVLNPPLVLVVVGVGCMAAALSGEVLLSASSVEATAP